MKKISLIAISVLLAAGVAALIKNTIIADDGELYDTSNATFKQWCDDDNPQKGCWRTGSGFVYSFAKNGVIVDRGYRPEALWFLYTKKKYTQGEAIGLYRGPFPIFEYVGTYEYKTTEGAINRIRAYKETGQYQDM